MTKEHDQIDAGTPALLVLCGATRKKWRPLQGDVVMLGRAKGCDIGLVSPEVSPVHCLIIRTLRGWRIRDCSGRATRVNGKAIQDEPLRNGDVLQIGTFSFEAKLPAVAAVAAVAPGEGQNSSHAAEHERLVRSRRNLIELALSMRHRLRDQEEERKAQTREIEQLRNDLDQLERRLRSGSKPSAEGGSSRKEPSAEGKPGEKAAPISAQQEEKLAARQAELDRYSAHLRRQAERFNAEKHAFARQAEVERAEFEADLIRQGIELKEQQESQTQWQQNLARRHAELEKMAGQLTDVLQHERDQLESERTQLQRDREQLTRDHQQLEQLRGEMEKLRTTASAKAVEPSSARETTFDNGGPDRLASARKLLQELAQRRKSTLKVPPPSGVVIRSGDTAH